MTAELLFITGPPTHSVKDSIVLLAGVCSRLQSSSVVAICRLWRLSSSSVVWRRFHPRRPGDDVMSPSSTAGQ